jgi:hypothetical protein
MNRRDFFKSIGKVGMVAAGVVQEVTAYREEWIDS